MGWVWPWKDLYSQGSPLRSGSEDPAPCTPAAGKMSPTAGLGIFTPLTLLFKSLSNVRPGLLWSHGNQRYTLKIKYYCVSGRGDSSICRVWAFCLPEPLIKPGPDSASAQLHRAKSLLTSSRINQHRNRLCIWQLVNCSHCKVKTTGRRIHFPTHLHVFCLH